MFDGKEDEPHDKQGAGSYAEFRIDFEVTEDDDGNMEGTMAQVHSHIHAVPVHALIDSILVVAKGLIVTQMEEMVHVPESAPQALRDHLLDAFAGMYLKQRIDSDNVRGVGVATITVPDDISELLD